MHRRHFLQQSMTAALPLAMASARLMAAPRAPARLLLVFLRGAYDCASLLVPVASDDYYALRPNLAIARPGSGADAALPLDAAWGLAPAVRDSLAPLYAQGQLAF